MYYLTQHTSKFSNKETQESFFSNEYFNINTNNRNDTLNTKSLLDFINHTLLINDFDSYNDAAINILTQKNQFYEILEAFSSQIIELFFNLIKDYNEKSIVILSIYMSTYMNIIQKSFNVSYSKLFKLKAKRIILNYLNNKSLYYIDKISIMISGDTWNTVNLTYIDKSRKNSMDDNDSYENEENNKEEEFLDNGYAFFRVNNRFKSNNNTNNKVPFYLKGFLNIFNDNQFGNDTKISFDLIKSIKTFETDYNPDYKLFNKIVCLLKANKEFPLLDEFTEFFNINNKIYLNKSDINLREETDKENNIDSKKLRDNDLKLSKNESNISGISVVSSNFNENCLLNNMNMLEVLEFYSNIFKILYNKIHFPYKIKNDTCYVNSNDVVKKRNKPLVFSTSCITVISSIEELVYLLVLYDEFIFDIFLKIFEIIDYFFVSVILMNLVSNEATMNYNNESQINKFILLCFEKIENKDKEKDTNASDNNGIGYSNNTNNKALEKEKGIDLTSNNDNKENKNKQNNNSSNLSSRGSFLSSAIVTLNSTINNLFLPTKLGFNYNDVCKKKGVKIESPFENCHLFNKTKILREYLLKCEKEFYSLLLDKSKNTNNFSNISNTSDTGKKDTNVNAGNTKASSINQSFTISEYLDICIKINQSKQQQQKQELIQKAANLNFIYPIPYSEFEQNRNSKDNKDSKDKDDAEEVLQFEKRIVSCECLFSILSLLKTTKSFSERLDLDFQINFIVDKIDLYSLVVKDFYHLNYYYIFQRYFKLDSILSKLSIIKHYNWEIKDSDTHYDFGEASSFVNEVTKEIESKLEIFNERFNEDVVQRLCDVLVSYLVMLLKDYINRIKKVSIIMYYIHNFI